MAEVIEPLSLRPDHADPSASSPSSVAPQGHPWSSELGPQPSPGISVPSEDTGGPARVSSMDGVIELWFARAPGARIKDCPFASCAARLLPTHNFFSPRYSHGIIMRDSRRR